MAGVKGKGISWNVPCPDIYNQNKVSSRQDQSHAMGFDIN
jgi:hypothetical protein